MDYFIETHKQNLDKYYKFKNKNDLSFSILEKEIFIKEITIFLKSFDWSVFDVVLIPETTNSLFKEIVFLLDKKIVVLKKNTKEEIILELDKQFLMKDERKKLYKTLIEMNDVKIALITANQRKRVANLLFKKSDEIKDFDRVVFFDDSVFTGSTLIAIN